MNWRADGTWRIVGTSLAPFVTRYEVLEKLFGELTDQPAHLDPDQRDAEVAVAVRAAISVAVDAEVKPIDDIRSTATYRRRVVLNLLCDAAMRALPT